LGFVTLAVLALATVSLEQP